MAIGVRMERTEAQGLSEREIVRVRVGSNVPSAAHATPVCDIDHDVVVVEEPLEIRIDGDPIATTMRTPGDDRALAVGFLLGEGVLRSHGDIGSVTHCGRPGAEGYGNVIDVVSAAGARLEIDRVEASRRGTLTTSACGVCGRRTIEDLLARCPRQRASGHVTARAVLDAIERMRSAQTLFSRTGGLHGAAAFDASASPRIVREDIGRHNAVDKVIGSIVLDPDLGEGTVLLIVSGRASFEMVQKTAMAGIPILASVSAVTSLAIDLAVKTGTTLIGFARDGRMNVYAGAERIRG